MGIRSEPREEQLHIRITAEEKTRLTRAAADDHRSVAEFVRHYVMEAVWRLEHSPFRHSARRTTEPTEVKQRRGARS